MAYAQKHMQFSLHRRSTRRCCEPLLSYGSSRALARPPPPTGHGADYYTTPDYYTLNVRKIAPDRSVFAQKPPQGRFLALARRERPSEALVRSGERGRGRFNGFRFCALPLAFFYDVAGRDIYRSSRRRVSVFSSQ